MQAYVFIVPCARYIFSNRIRPTVAISTENQIKISNVATFCFGLIGTIGVNLGLYEILNARPIFSRYSEKILKRARLLCAN